MVKKLEGQNGNVRTTVIIIIVVIVLALAATIGLVLWNRSHNASPAPTPASSNDQSSTTDTKDKPPVTERLTVSDWTISFTLPAGLTVSNVVDYKTHVGEGSDYYGFTTARVKAQGGKCDNQVTGNLVTLTRSTTKNGHGTLIGDSAIGGYFYYYSSSVDDIKPAPTCLSTDIAKQDHALLNDMVQTLKAD